ncbi:MAG: hypothetical protein ACE5NC_02685, partial [Anaerolineae bacterium]
MNDVGISRRLALSALMVTLMLTAQGCAKEVQQAHAVRNGAETYRQGVRDTLEQLRQRGGLPVIVTPEPPRIYWVGPVMEEVWVPARVVG